MCNLISIAFSSGSSSIFRELKVQCNAGSVADKVMRYKENLRGASGVAAEYCWN